MGWCVSFDMLIVSAPGMSWPGQRCATASSFAACRTPPARPGCRSLRTRRDLRRESDCTGPSRRTDREQICAGSARIRRRANARKRRQSITPTSAAAASNSSGVWFTQAATSRPPGPRQLIVNGTAIRPGRPGRNSLRRLLRRTIRAAVDRNLARDLLVSQVARSRLELRRSGQVQP